MLILLVICNLFSITGTAQKKAVILDSIQSKKVIKDVVRLDYLIKKDSINKKVLFQYKASDSTANVEIDKLRKSIEKKDEAFAHKESETKDLNGIIINWEKIYNKEVNKKEIYKYGLGGALIYIFLKVIVFK
jgi:MinD-like ATPase involved in chromosome partitioning or flagellar assembly